MINFINESSALFPFTRKLRREFHMHPELGFKEERTSKVITRELTSMGVKIKTGLGGTGITGTIKGKKPGPVLLIRADMDALPISEETGLDFSSKNRGVMHACGHDGHMAILLSVAKFLVNNPDSFNGTVKLLFQPAEEGLGGAEAMIKAGVLKNPKPEFSLTLHLWNEEHLGWYGVSTGPTMAGAEIFKIKVRGKGGHGASPHLTADPIVAAANIINSLQTITSRNVPPLNSAVVSVCTINGGEAFNIIPQEVLLAGTIRTFKPEIRAKVLERFEVIVYGIAETLGCQAEVDLKQLTPAVINHPEIARRVAGVASILFPNAIIHTSNNITMGSEDMAFIMEEIPGCYFLIGSANPETHQIRSHHHSKFDFDEQALENAVSLMCAATLDLLNDPPF